MKVVMTDTNLFAGLRVLSIEIGGPHNNCLRRGRWYLRVYMLLHSISQEFIFDEVFPALCLVSV